MSFELQLVKEGITEEIKRTEHWDRPWNKGRIEGLKHALGLVKIALGEQVEEVENADTKD